MSCSRPGLPVHHQLPEPTQTHVQAGSLWAEQLGSEVAQSCPTLCDPMDCTVHGILQARILEWIAFLFSRDIPNPGIEPRSPALQVDSLPTEPQGKPKNTGVGSLSLLHQIFPKQEFNQSLLHCRRILYQLSCQGVTREAFMKHWHQKSHSVSEKCVTWPLRTDEKRTERLDDKWCTSPRGRQVVNRYCTHRTDKTSRSFEYKNVQEPSLPTTYRSTDARS